ncbi:MAG: hypothetical protein A2487_07290 [Candidatus Raymondbacteria bacterium RifOxyC12_full_50_8]|uniref:Helicase SNF2 n=1 Tax=Candidatus Raymondbacteria bacterium RIFOXYD12_FULL_49_13 TaxID=1817890 RepID=A0A1F7F3L7_UNCRA|nr:MAG: hypothetical protein A2248_08880 [Candidatus Raymondbacteria bacterium RIFOXYA2_FULL_49_16]OGJ96783.1 MAG: hypothetical protein A2487_07290 [Candidatus Raymondbacteria bacterium RifOxyC12_full_50_8]OGK01127.1 MAG: hypothetical protein A2519_20410 [Candidatus Raymondbacteria bacterium RIFOXYD12_FULL_49_13]OGP39348.1 MAG: hypothetical protein A2324_16920 [Candidatus Raymondbacteria bacterium RIFOXYB2_FULL_49_35]
MNISAIRDGIEPHIFHRGKEYLTAYRVEFIKQELNILRFKVKGTEDYSTSLFLDDNAASILKGSCTCPYGGNCKHIAAAALYAERSPNIASAAMVSGHNAVVMSTFALKPLTTFLKRYIRDPSLIEEFTRDPENKMFKVLSALESHDYELPDEFMSCLEEYKFRFNKKLLKELEEKYDDWCDLYQGEDADFPEEEEEEGVDRKAAQQYQANFDRYHSFIYNLAPQVLSGSGASDLEKAVPCDKPRFGLRIKDASYTYYGAKKEYRYEIQLLFDRGDKFLIVKNPERLMADIVHSGCFSAGNDRFRTPVTAITPAMRRASEIVSASKFHSKGYAAFNSASFFNALPDLCRDGIPVFFNNREPVELSDLECTVSVELDYDKSKLKTAWSVVINGVTVPGGELEALLPGQPMMALHGNVLVPFPAALPAEALKSLIDADQTGMALHGLVRWHERFVEPLSAVINITCSGKYKKALGTIEEFGIRLTLDYLNDKGAFLKLEFLYGSKSHTPLVCRIGEKDFDPFKEGKDKTRDFVREHEFITLINRHFNVARDGSFVFYGENEDVLLSMAHAGLAKYPHVREVVRTPAFEQRFAVRQPAPSFSVTGSDVDFLEISFTLGDGILPEETGPIMEAVRQGQKYYRLKNGALLMLESTDLSMFIETISALGKSRELFAGKPARLTKADMLYMSVCMKEENNLLPDAVQAEISGRLREFDTYEPPELAAGFCGTLRGYQQTGFHWLHKMSSSGFNVILADDMGLGKTVQTIALLINAYSGRDSGAPPPSLIVCPSILVYNWMAELSRFAPELRTAALYGNKGDRDALFREKKCNVYVTSYATMQRDIEMLSETRFLYAILDEAQKIKNRSTQSFKCCRLIRADHRFALTGTPVENRQTDLVSIFEYLEPGFLRSGEISAGFKADSGKETGILKRRTSPFILRRMKRQVLDDLPAKSEQTLTCELGDAQKKLYVSLRAEFEGQARFLINDKGIERSRIHILALLTRLKQVCCHPMLIDASGTLEAAGSAKLDLLLELMEEIMEGGHRVLVFSQFTSMLAIIHKRLEKNAIKCSYMDGETKDRLALVDAFNKDSSIPCFLISLRTGGHGINLTGADTVIHYDQWWNPAVEEQATDRVHRIGQSKEVTVYKLICKGTIEEKIVELQKKKRELFASLVDESQGGLNLTAEDIAELLAG